MRIARIGIFVAAGLTIAGCAKPSRPAATAIAGHPGYHIRQAVTLPATDVPEARLELLEDSRITPATRAIFQRGVPDDACASPTNETVHAFCDTIRHQLLRPAMLRIADASDRDLDTTTLDRPIADIMLVIDDPAASRRFYGVSVDLTADMGTYSGPYVRLLDQRSRRFDWLHSRDSSSGEVDEVHLVTTPKTAWRLAPGPDGSNSDILSVACRPTFADKKKGTKDGFEVVYDRYTFVGNELQRHRRAERGFWENDGQFPPRSRFP
jgi:hypothetical protein